MGLLRLHILFHAREESVYGAGLIRKMREHGVSISPGTIYPILHNMETEGFLKSHKSVIKGKVRKYYKLTEKGHKTLKETGNRVRDLIEGVLEIPKF